MTSMNNLKLETGLSVSSMITISVPAKCCI